MSDQRNKERLKAMIFTAIYEQKGHILLGFLGDLNTQRAMDMGEK